jgi:hypothetical protein
MDPEFEDYINSELRKYTKKDAEDLKKKMKQRNRYARRKNKNNTDEKIKRMYKREMKKNKLSYTNPFHYLARRRLLSTCIKKVEDQNKKR